AAAVRAEEALPGPGPRPPFGRSAVAGGVAVAPWTFKAYAGAALVNVGGGAMSEPSLPEESIFAQALERSAAERAAFLDRACGGRPALRAAVEALLRAHGRGGDLLDLPDKSVATVDEPPVGETPGACIGPYKLLEQIGEGGFGVVYLAEQTQPV